jgi:hypothetical protein
MGRLKEVVRRKRYEVDHGGQTFTVTEPNGHALDVLMPLLNKVEGDDIGKAPARFWATLICAGLCEDDGTMIYDVTDNADIEEVMNESPAILKVLGNKIASLAGLLEEDDTPGE